ncbi:MAG TPA: S-methyl-5-thioribose-1-phosphate isomerase [Caulobacteraceae bacterium]|nr:S-methyl-5-thioribose-1-phosphate isomerase [Caulobacteraceae bacterium]
MKIDGVDYRTIWRAKDGRAVNVIDQTALPHALRTQILTDLEDARAAIADMIVRGAPLIGATGAYGMALATQADGSDAAVAQAAQVLADARPTAVNLKWAVDRAKAAILACAPADRAQAAWAEADAIAEEDVLACAAIGQNGLPLIRQAAKGGERVNILTHCNAGWLATVDWGTALSPIYAAHDAGIAVHVWVDETRPRGQGAALTAWELGRHGVPHTVIADNAGGHLMQQGQVDLCIVGSDRVAANGDVCNKIGTYLKALAARDNGVPFYAALPFSTIDWTLRSGGDIPIEERSAREVTHQTGLDENGDLRTVRLTPQDSPAANPAFDVTPARLVSAIITERGVCEASAEGLRGLYPEAP